MADFTPTQYIKGATVKTAYTWAEHYQLTWEGYVPIGEAVVNPRAKIPAMLSDVDAVEDQAEAATLLAAANDMRTTGLKHISKVEADYRSSPRLGPATTDITSFVQNSGPDATFNRAYSFLIAPNVPVANGTPPAATFPIDMGEGIDAYVSNFHAGWGSQNAMPRSVRFMSDGNAICWYEGAGNVDKKIWIDGRPLAVVPTGGTGGLSSGYNMPYRSGNAAAHFNIINFPTLAIRQIEIRTAAYLQAFYTKKPYELWRPPVRRGPKVLIIGDSFTSSAGATNSMDAIYWNIGPAIGSEDVWVDQIGGTGYGVTSAADGSGTGNRYLDRIVKNTHVPWNIANIKPDIIVVHGGGANDKYKGRSNAQVIADVIAMFNGLRAAAPTAKLVFVEGFSPPIGFSTFNPDYIAIRTAAQAALTSTGVYYIDVATTKPWIQGTGYNSTGDPLENSYAYISSDGVHPKDAGHLYIRARMAQKIRRIMADDGTLLNTLL